MVVPAARSRTKDVVKAVGVILHQVAGEAVEGYEPPVRADANREPAQAFGAEVAAGRTRAVEAEDRGIWPAPRQERPPKEHRKV